MSTGAVSVPLSAETASGRPRAWRAVVGSVEGRIGLALLVAMLLLIVFGPLLAPHDPAKIGVGAPQASPSAGLPLGTDELGRDVFSRYLNGGRGIVLIPLAATVLAFLVGGVLGLAGAYRGGRTDAFVARVLDLGIALPALLLTLVLIAGLGTSPVTLTLVIALVTAPRAGRVIRGAAQTVVGNDYVTAAQLRGESAWYVMTREILPNAAGPILTIFSLYLTYAIIAISTLSFLGLGAQPPSSDWGLMVAEGRAYLTVNPWATLVPALSIGVLAVAFTLISDAIGQHIAGDGAEG